MSKIVKDQNLTRAEVSQIVAKDATITTLRLPKTTGTTSATASGYFIVNVSGINRKVAYIN